MRLIDTSLRRLRAIGVDRLFKALLLPVVLLTALAAGASETGGAPWTLACLFDTLFDIECWGCGITRAIVSLLHGQWEQSWSHNIMAFPVLAVITAVSLREYFVLFKKRLDHEH